MDDDELNLMVVTRVSGERAGNRSNSNQNISNNNNKKKRGRLGGCVGAGALFLIVCHCRAAEGLEILDSFLLMSPIQFEN